MASNVESTSNAAHSSVSFAVGEKFSCFTDFQKKLTEYERHNAVQLSCRDSRTLEAAAKRVPKRVLGAPSDLKYYEIQYSIGFHNILSQREHLILFLVGNTHVFLVEKCIKGKGVENKSIRG